MSKKRNYNKDYLPFGFTFITKRDGIQKPVFPVWQGSCQYKDKASKAKGALHVCSSCKLFRVDIFQEKAWFEKVGMLPRYWFTPTQRPYLEASYKVAYHIAKQKKPHTIGETLIKPCAL